MNGPEQETSQAALLAGEQLRIVLCSKQGLATAIPASEDYLALTEQRVIARWGDGTRRKEVAMPLERVDAVDLTVLSRDVKSLVTGVLLIAGGVIVPFLSFLLSLNGVVAWLLGAILVLLGIVTSSSYFAPEARAVLLLRAGGAEAALPLHTEAAVKDAGKVAGEVFALKAAQKAAKDASPYALVSPYGPPVRWSRDSEPPPPVVTATVAVQPEVPTQANVETRLA